MNKNIVFVVVFYFLSAVFSSLYLYDAGQKNISMAEPVKVIVAATRIGQGETITETQIKERVIPKQYAQPKYISDRKDFYVDGNPYFISTLPIEEGEQITSSKITPISFGTGISNIIPDGKRAITLIFDTQEIKGIISAGNKVDLLSIVEYETKNKEFEEASCMVAQDLLVLSVGTSVMGTSNLDADTPVSVNIPVTLAVSVEQAQKIILAQEKGTIKLILRAISDDSILQNKPININDIYADAVPASKVKDSSNKQAAINMQKRQKEVNEILSKYYNQK
ncbi:MAG: Flp pilus assembly protein CpaB, partial [Elusimicrobia bacterium]|nr:Flp pilus assembly protein CpaB [Elusimicrobiota bacterium]